MSKDCPGDGIAMPAHLELCSIGAGVLPVPLGPPDVILVRRAEQSGPESLERWQDLGPVLPGLLAAQEWPVGMHGLLAAVPRVEGGDKRWPGRGGSGCRGVAQAPQSPTLASGS